MEEITATVKLNADNAGQAHQLAQSVSDTADRGSEMVCYVIEKMRDIAGSSTRIADILSVIDGIAFQTNILALNASVEAARAGEQGRGFAVVAGEVRNLASRSADAAKEIRSLISDSQTHVNEGSELAQQAGETMDEIATEVLRMTKLMREIATASQEQSRGIEQVNIAVNQMDETAQQNAALVQQSSAATRSTGGTIARADGGDGILQTDGANGMIKIGEPVGLPYLRVTRPGIRGSCVQRLPPCGRCRQRTNGAGAGFPARYPEYALYRHSLCRLPVRPGMPSGCTRTADAVFRPGGWRCLGRGKYHPSAGYGGNPPPASRYSARCTGAGWLYPLPAEFDVLLHAIRESDVVAFVDGVGIALLREAHALRLRQKTPSDGS